MSAVDVVREQIEHLRDVHEATNCVAAWNAAAESQAAALDARFAAGDPIGPLHGVPITVKDWIDVAGMPCTGGDIAHRDRVPTRDATVVARLHAAGAIVIAKTTVQSGQRSVGPGVQPGRPHALPGRVE